MAYHPHNENTKPNKTMNNTKTNQTTTSAKPVKLSKRGGEFDLPTGYITAYPTVKKFSSTFSSVTSNGLGTNYEGNQTLTNGIQVEIKLTDWDSANGDVQQIDGKGIRLEVDASALRQYITAFLDDPGQINFELGDLEEIVAEYKNR